MWKALKAIHLMRKAIEHLRARGVAECQAHVDRGNEPAIRFNAAMGFELLPEPTGPGGRRRTMIKRLQKSGTTAASGA